MEPRVSIVTLGVADLALSHRFYHKGMGLPTTRNPNSGIVFFQTSGVCLALYPIAKLAEDFGDEQSTERGPFSGITLAHNTRTKEEVDATLQQAVDAGGRIVKPAQDVFWGGYSGYFSDPDGYLWEVAYADSWVFNEDGSLLID
jgi:catechol 2,3-dioxygenase-like lactoylglutathione lyase family enzyme